MAAVFRSSSDKPASGAVLDRAGICVSAVCLVQCVVLSLTIVLAPMISLGVFGSDAFHRILLAIILPLSMAAFIMGYRAHRRGLLLVAGLAGMAMILAAAVLEATVLGPLTASLLTSIGGASLIVGHWFNLRMRRRACMHSQR